MKDNYKVEDGLLYFLDSDIVEVFADRAGRGMMGTEVEESEPTGSEDVLTTLADIPAGLLAKVVMKLLHLAV